MARTFANDPLQKFMFRVTIPGLPTGIGFQKVGGLTNTHYLVRSTKVSGHTALGALCKHCKNQQYACDNYQYDE